MPINVVTTRGYCPSPSLNPFCYPIPPPMPPPICELPSSVSETAIFPVTPSTLTTGTWASVSTSGLITGNVAITSISLQESALGNAPVATTGLTIGITARYSTIFVTTATVRVVVTGVLTTVSGTPVTRVYSGVGTVSLLSPDTSVVIPFAGDVYNFENLSTSNFPAVAHISVSFS